MSGLPGPFGFLRPLGAVGGTAIGFAVGHGVSPAIRPVIQDLANQAWELHQVRPLEPSIAAQLVAESLWSQGQGEAEAARSGINADRFGALVAQAREGPTIEQALVGLRRGLLDGADFDRALRQAGIRPEWDELLRALQTVLPSVTDMVRFGVREVYDSGARAALDLDAEFPPAFAADAERIGLDRETAGNYWAAHWDLPSYEQGVRMLFRGEISQGQFEALLKALDYAPTWRQKLLNIAKAIPPLQDMIRFAVRDAYSPETVSRFGLDAEFPAVFGQQAELHGMEPENSQLYWRAHWRLPSALQGYRMLWRGEITAAELDLLLKTLDYPPFWRDRLANIARIVPGRIDLKRLLRHEIITQAEVLAGYKRLGYGDQDAQHMTDIAVAETETGAVAQRWAERARGRLFTALQNDFMDGTTDEAAARTGLARLGATGAEVGTVIGLWSFERDSTVRDLTQAQVLKLFKKTVWTREQTLGRLEDMGMVPSEAADLLDAQ